MKSPLTILAFLLLTVAASAQSRHLVRLGWGDMMFETVAFHATEISAYPDPEKLPSGFRSDEKEHFRYTGHIFADYSYRLNKLLRVGLQADFQGIFWKETVYDAWRKPVGESVAVNNYDLTILPTVSFTYLERPWFRLYCGVGVGVVMAFDNLKEFQTGTAFNLNPVGIQVGRGHWSGSAELGCLCGLRGSSNIFMMNSRLFSVSVNYSW